MVLRRGFTLGRRARKVNTYPEFEMLQVDNALKGFFEREQYEAVVRHLPNYLKPVARAAYITGWRTASELLTRQWRHVNFANAWLRLDPGESKKGEGREFPLTPQLRAILEEQRERVRAVEKATGTTYRTYLSISGLTAVDTSSEVAFAIFARLGLRRAAMRASRAG